MEKVDCFKNVFDSIGDTAQFGDDFDCNSGFRREVFLSPLTVTGQTGFCLKNQVEDIELGHNCLVVLLAGVPKVGVSRALYSGEYKANKLPDCLSNDGIHPTSQDPVAESCKDCPKSKWGSGSNGNGRACREYKQMVLCLIHNDQEEVVTLRISGKSIFNLSHYIQNFETHGLGVYKFATRLSVDPDNSYPVVSFEVEAAIDPDEHDRINDFINSPEVVEQLNR